MLAGTGLPAADSSAAFARSRPVRLVRPGSYSGLGRVPAGVGVQPVDHLGDVCLPPGRLLHGGGGQAFQPDAWPRPPGRGGRGISNCGSVTSSAIVAVLTVPSSAAIRTRPPGELMTPTLGLRRPGSGRRSRPAAGCAAHGVPPAWTTVDMPSGAVRSAASCRCHIRWNSTGSTRSRSPASSAPSDRPRPPGECLQQHRGDLWRQAPPVPVAGQPPHVRHQHQVKVPGLRYSQPAASQASAVTANVSASRDGNPVIGPDVDDHRAPIMPCGRRNPAHAAGTCPPSRQRSQNGCDDDRPHCRGRSPSASDGLALARTRTRYGRLSWRSTTSPRSSEGLFEPNGRAGTASSKRVP